MQFLYSAARDAVQPEFVDENQTIGEENSTCGHALESVPQELDILDIEPAPAYSRDENRRVIREYLLREPKPKFGIREQRIQQECHEAGMRGEDPTRKGRKRRQDAERARRYRENKRAKEAATPISEADLAELIASIDVSEIEPVDVPEKQIKAEREALEAWLLIDGPRQRQLRGKVEDIMLSRIALLRARLALGTDPGYETFAKFWAGELRDAEGVRPSKSVTKGGAALTNHRDINKHSSRRRVALLKTLEADGPWKA